MAILRDYQIECLEAIKRDFAAGFKRLLVVMATGSGKTITFLGLIDQLKPKRCLIIAHRRELIYQPIEKARQFYPALAEDMGVVMADEDDTAARIVVATVQTVCRPHRAERMGEFDLVIVDEAHHVTASTYKTILARYPNALVIGWTATPVRTDQDGLSRVFEKCSYRLPISECVLRGILVPFNALGVGVPITLAGLAQTEDGWEADGLGRVMSSANVLELVFDNWKKYAGDKRTIIFTASVEQAHETAIYFQRQGVKAAWVSGETPKRERDSMLAAYQRGEIQVVCNCQVLTEGFDAPSTGAILMAAPTKSDLVYVQRLGRGLRQAPGKSECVVLDFAPLDERSIILAADVLGQPRAVVKAQKKAEAGGVLVGLRMDKHGCASIDPGDLVIRVLDLLRHDSLAWSVIDGYATAALSADWTAVIILPETERMSKAERTGQTDHPLYARIASFRLWRVDGSAECVGAFNSFEYAKGKADELALEVGGASALTKRKAKWRREPPTLKQREFLQRLRVEVPRTKGQAAQMITHTLAVRRVIQAERFLQETTP